MDLGVLSLKSHGLTRLILDGGNGYVGVGIDHPLYGKTYWDEGVMELDVHGGITFSEKDGLYWVFGFDTAHYEDTLDRWPKDAVIKETLKLMHQLKEMV